ncbi:lysophospholipid acyltransferase family protein [Tenacibaculum tangerinum]|uniref:Lysophospholipid acyltransferase family protein n=1 Tax=Tenacibaculum tangerinum TaxID=3038772 RepID=A0ABY8L2L1_9FLAO|nr:lysophospholipid acyltransferase family protein [Tenacibaculum tangerinum]WGH75499.1 lysophospholipid acyltransferase family protein [Tenacibaculum tangerinum]
MAFPEKSDTEIKLLTKKSLHHFFDFMVETVKTFTISKKEIQKRFVYTNVELLQELEKSGKSIILMGAHYGNWEWTIHLGQLINYKPYAAYTKIRNSYFEKIIKSSRSKFGGRFIRTSDTIKTIAKNKQDNLLSLYALLGDQSPQLHKTHYWGHFFNMHVPVITGPEMLAKKYDFNVVYFDVSVVKRGYYEATFKLITQTPLEYENYEITDIFLKMTEAHIRKNPEYYLWTHKRFKHKDKYEQWKENRKASQI